MKSQISRWGNSAAVRLPRAILDDLRLSTGSEVEMWVEGRELRLRAAPSTNSYRLEDLLAQIDARYIPELEEWPPVGAEIIRDDDSK